MDAFVLAGGQSTRMGRDKTLMRLAGRPLIEHALDKLRNLGFNPRIVGTRPDLASFAPVIPDLFPRAGPLGGIASALAVSSAEQNLLLPVDCPWLPVVFLLWLVQRAGITGALATIPRLQGLPQPLCAVYRRELMPHAQAAIREGDAKVTRAVDRCARAIGQLPDSFDVESIAAAESWPWPHRWFVNLNTPDEFQKAVLEQSSRFQ